MIVVDTNVVAYLLIEGERTASARELWRQDSDWQLPELWRHEFLNVLATYARLGGAPVQDAENIWWAACDLLGGGLHAVDMSAALRLAVEAKVSAYDAQFVVLAQLLGVKLVTEDKHLLALFADLAVSLQAYRQD